MPPKPKPRRLPPCAWLPYGSMAIACAPCLRGGSELADDAEPQPCIGGVAVRGLAPGRPHLCRCAQPGPAADHARPAPRVHPGLAVGGCTPVTLVPAVGHPLADVARKVVKTECIGRETTHWRGTPCGIAIALEGIAPC